MRIKTETEQLKQAFQNLAENESFKETNERLKNGEEPHDMVKTMAMSEHVLKAMLALGDEVYPGGSLPRQLKELVILNSSIHNSCQFCTKSHIDITKGLGISDDPEAFISQRDKLNDCDQAALAYQDAVIADSNCVSEETISGLRIHFSESEIVELTFLIGYINMLNWFNNALGVEYRGELAP